MFRVEEKKLTIEITESYDPMPLPLQLMSTFMNVRHLLCTDWEIYKHIVFHLLQNAINFSQPGNKIEI